MRSGQLDTGSRIVHSGHESNLAYENVRIDVLVLGIYLIRADLPLGQVEFDWMGWSSNHAHELK